MRMLDLSLPDLLEEYLRPYRRDFCHRKRAAWAAVYLQGLLCCPDRKTVENMARAVQLPDGLHADNVAQALQHFVGQSPWQETQVWRRYLSLAAERLPADGLLVAAELTFVKQGRHSVGVHRQHSEALGRKANAQIAVALYHVGPTACVPLLLRLYLPRGWLENPARLDAAGVPDSCRHYLTKSALALELLDAARSAGVGGSGVAVAGRWSLLEDFARALARRGLAYQAEVSANLEGRLARLGRELQHLGLSHYEGRSWRGFHHHACLVTLAHAFTTTRAGSGEPPFAVTGTT